MLYSSLFYLLLMLKYNFLKDEARKTLKALILKQKLHSTCKSSILLNLKTATSILFGKSLFERTG